MMVMPALGALNAVVMASSTAMVLRPLHREDVGTAAAAPPAMVPRPLRLGDVVVVARAKPPLIKSLSPASKWAFCFVAFVSMAMRINAELLMLSQKWKNGGMVM